jgi:hypothetical protein
MTASTLPPPVPHRRPLWLGALLAPCVAPFALAWLAVMVDGGSASQGDAAFFEVLAFALVFGLPLAYAATWLLGLPVAVWLRRRGRLGTLLLVLVAAPLGSLSLLAAFAVFGAKLAFVAQVGIGALLGATVALVFCLVCGIPWHARAS